MRPILLLLISIPLLMLTLALSAQNESDSVEIAVLTEKNWDKFVPQGKEVDAIYGDIVLRNRSVVAVIAKPVATRNANMTVRNVGGCLIDLASRSFESDQLSCFYPAGTNHVYRGWNVRINETPETDVQSNTSLTGNSGEVTVISKGTDGRVTVKTTYRLRKESQALEIETEYINDSKKTVLQVPTDRIRADGGKERMRKSPNGTTESFWIDDQYWQQAYVLQAPGYRVQSNSDSRTSNLKYLNSRNLDIFSIAPEDSVTLLRELSVGPSWSDANSAFSKDAQRNVAFTLSDRNGIPISDAVIEMSREGTSQGVLRTSGKGTAAATLPVGVLKLNLKRYGIDIHGAQREIEITKGDTPQAIDWKIEEYLPGRLKINIQDESGTALPCKVEIVGIDGTTTPDFGPETAEFAVKNLRYTPDGMVDQPLTKGEYLLRISRGPEYSAEEMSLQIDPGETFSRTVTLHRVIKTPGWVSTDFHSHSTPSGDNTSSQLGRVLNLVCQHIEFAPCTEHNRIDTYQDHFDELKINSWISSVTGMELTGSPLPLNHQNVFPLHHHPHRQDGGGPITDSDVATQIRRISTWDNGSEKLIQQNHPDVGWLFYDKNGDGTHDQGHADAVAFIDVMEIHPIQRILQSGTLGEMTEEAAKKNRIFKWLQLLNQGYRIPGVVNSDSHYNFHGSGWIRNWVQSSTDDPAKIDHMEMVKASEDGRVVMSNGPYLQMSAKAGFGNSAIVGEDLGAPSKKVTVNVTVQCPNWFSVDTVFLLLNGKTRKDLIFTTKSDPDLFVEQGEGGRKIQRFEKEIQLELAEDTHIIAVTGNSQTTMGPFLGKQWGSAPPSALTNPIFVDIDGNGFTPNKDTLGRPLPVKGD